MKVICARCEEPIQELEDDRFFDRFRISYGICEECLRKMENEERDECLMEN